MVKIEILKEEDNKILVLLSKTDRSFANALRRSLISDTPKMAIDSVRFQPVSYTHLTLPTTR